MPKRKQREYYYTLRDEVATLYLVEIGKPRESSKDFNYLRFQRLFRDQAPKHQIPLKSDAYQAHFNIIHRMVRGVLRAPTRAIREKVAELRAIKQEVLSTQDTRPEPPPDPRFPLTESPHPRLL